VKGEDCIDALKALGEESRLRILRRLLSGEASVGAVSEALKISQYNVSRHLAVLRNAGLVEMRKAGRERFYRVADAYRARVSGGKKVMDLGCCSFCVDQLPK
jgi:DNA-binding transcriptional ArsR family regulator